MKLDDLEIYRMCLELSKQAWNIYQHLHWQIKKIIGDQWITAIDSIGANIAEGFGRFHFLDKNKFNYNARGSLLESQYWTTVLCQRNIINGKEKDSLIHQLENLHHKLNNYINSTKDQIT